MYGLISLVVLNHICGFSLMSGTCCSKIFYYVVEFYVKVFLDLALLFLCKLQNCRKLEWEWLESFGPENTPLCDPAIPVDLKLRIARPWKTSCESKCVIENGTFLLHLHIFKILWDVVCVVKYCFIKTAQSWAACVHVVTTKIQLLLLVWMSAEWP